MLREKERDKDGRTTKNAHRHHGVLPRLVVGASQQEIQRPDKPAFSNYLKW